MSCAAGGPSYFYSAFEYTANTILQVGQQSIVASLLQSGNDALRIDTCNETLTELVALFNVRPYLWLVCLLTDRQQLEEVVDVHRWQREFEAARVRDHEELSLMGQRLESGNAAIARELAQQGTTINEVYNLVQVRRFQSIYTSTLTVRNATEHQRQST